MDVDALWCCDVVSALRFCQVKGHLLFVFLTITNNNCKFVSYSLQYFAHRFYNIVRAPPTFRQRMLAELYCFWLVRLSVCLSVCPSVRGHSNSVIFNWISSKFHIWIASINLSFKFEYGFCPTSITKMVDKMAAAYHCRGHSDLVIFYRISFKFQI